VPIKIIPYVRIKKTPYLKPYNNYPYTFVVNLNSKKGVFENSMEFVNIFLNFFK